VSERRAEAAGLLRGNRWFTAAENLERGLASPAEVAEQVRAGLAVMRCQPDDYEADALEILDELAAEDT
jgi:hypothetical protein